ncbi:MAG: hypothetical protein EAZ92_11440 [Candidatus Kapaibacterium sp.]|nr:MAG: hypothetical protein EAZ92_11440 [Candidatus Kapabacteria bacterium]
MFRKNVVDSRAVAKQNYQKISIFASMNTQEIIPPANTDAHSGTEAASEQHFHYRLDFYWQAVAAYAIALIAYALVKGTIIDGSLTLTLRDPVMIVLAVVVVASCLVSLAAWFMRRTITIGTDFIRLQTRLRTRTFSREQIAGIALGKKKLLNVRGSYRLAKIRLANRRRLLRIRPSLYEQEQELVQALIAFKRRLG